MRRSDDSLERVDPHLSQPMPIRASYNCMPRPRPLISNIHYAFELGIVCKGRMARYYDDVKLCLGPGEVWLTGIWEPHGGEVVASPCEAAVFMVHPPMLVGQRFDEAPEWDFSAPFTVKPALRPRGGDGQSAALLDCGRRLRAILAGPATVESRLRARLLFYEVLLLLRDGWSRLPEPRGIHPDRHDWVNHAIQMVFGTQKPISTMQAARSCSMSRANFDRLFARLMGVTFAAFELRHRLHGAAQQMLRTDDPLKTIAADWGFADASHLHRRFVELYGCCPAEYRSPENH